MAEATKKIKLDLKCEVCGDSVICGNNRPGNLKLYFFLYYFLKSLLTNFKSRVKGVRYVPI